MFFAITISCFAPMPRIAQNVQPMIFVLSWAKENQSGISLQYAFHRTLTLKLWDELTVYTTDYRLHIDNNSVENKIRPVAIGRKNFLFMGSHQHAQYSAMLYSFFASCALNDINPEVWLQDVIERIGATPKEDYHTLLPNKWKKAVGVN